MGRILAHVKKPSRYLGNEFNTCRKIWDEAGLRVALVFPDLYEIGMSHHGLQILYTVINSRKELLADRVYCPDTDLEELLRGRNMPLFAVETRRALHEFDMLGITLPYELCYTNILTILKLGRIPIRSIQREETHPFIIGGGSGAFNPEPVAEFFDAILLGDGEEAVLEIAGVLKGAKERKLDRTTVLEELAAINGVYVPSFFEPSYDRQGKLLAVKVLKKGYESVRRRILPGIDQARTPEKPLVPLMRIVHDRLGLEVARGCTRGCRFCQAGIIYRPVRERSAARVLELAEKGMAAGGFEELALLSLSTGDYSCLSPVLGHLMDRFVKEYVSISMPSMRVGTLTPEIMRQIKRVRKTGFTLAPEAGTDRLRQVINKGITEEDLLKTCLDANRLGWKLLKFYFMFGLPTETDEDIEAIADLVRRAANVAADRQLRINVSVATFVPKAHTPFQWEPQIPVAEAFAKIDLLKKRLPKGNYKLKWHDPRQSFLEGVMSRGDRLLAQVIEAAWERGARLDAWSEKFDCNIWLEAGRACGIEISNYLRRRDIGEILPWQHLDTGLDSEFLETELQKSQQGEYTQDCRVHGCHKCGVCDFKEIRPVVQCKMKQSNGDSNRPEAGSAFPLEEKEGVHETEPAGEAAGEKQHHWYRMLYAKRGDIRFLSHLELIQAFFQAFRRAGVQLCYTQGFNPVPRASFSPALPVGTESEAEYIDIDLAAPIENADNFLSTVNRQLPEGIMIRAVSRMPDKPSKAVAGNRTGYVIDLAQPLTPENREVLRRFLAGASYTLQKIRKGRKRLLDIRKQVETMTVSGDTTIDMVLRSVEGKAAAKPAEILQELLHLTDDECLDMRILKLWHKNLDV